MESLALLVSGIVLSVAVSGVLAWTLTVNGYIYIGGLVGCLAVALGGMFVCTAVMPVALVGWLAVVLGAWSILHVWLGKPPY